MTLSAVCCAVGLVASAGEPQLAGAKYRVLFEFGSQSGEQMEAVLNNVRAAKGHNSAAERTNRVTFSSAAAQS
jgi:hypothetical protein